jgi:hypothetical protein
VVHGRKHAPRFWIFWEIEKVLNRGLFFVPYLYQTINDAKVNYNDDKKLILNKYGKKYIANTKGLPLLPKCLFGKNHQDHLLQ